MILLVIGMTKKDWIIIAQEILGNVWMIYVTIINLFFVFSVLISFQFIYIYIVMKMKQIFH